MKLLICFKEAERWRNEGGPAIRRTRRMLKQGLAELMREKEFNDISIKDITDRMDLNRGTFYLHYADTYELLGGWKTTPWRISRP